MESGKLLNKDMVKLWDDMIGTGSAFCIEDCRECRLNGIMTEIVFPAILTLENYPDIRFPECNQLHTIDSSGTFRAIAEAPAIISFAERPFDPDRIIAIKHVRNQHHEHTNTTSNRSSGGRNS